MYALNSEFYQQKAKSKMPCAIIPELFLRYLNEEEIILLDQGRFTVHFSKGDLLIKQETGAVYVIVLLEGFAKVYIENNQKEMIMSIQKPGAILGGPGVYTNNIYPYSVKALTKSVVCLIESKTFKKLMEANNQFALAFIKDLSNNLVFGMQRLVGLAQNQMNGRIAEAILYLSQVYENEIFSLVLSRKEIGQLSSLSTDSVVRVLKQFESDKLIKFEKKNLTILNKKKLIEISSWG